VALEAVKGTKTVNKIVQEFGVHRPKLINGKRTCWIMQVACSKASVDRNQLMSIATPIGCTPRLGS